MRLRTRFSKTLPFVAIALSAATAAAQPVFTLHRSIELRPAHAQFVVRGTISHLSRTAPDSPPEGEAIYTITVQMDEVIKGPRRRAAEFIAKTMISDDEFERFAARRTSFLCFGNTTSDATNGK